MNNMGWWEYDHSTLSMSSKRKVRKEYSKWTRKTKVMQQDRAAKLRNHIKMSIIRKWKWQLEN